MTSFFRIAQLGMGGKKIRIVNINGKKTMEVSGLPADQCEKVRRYYEMQQGLSQEDVLAESKHTGVEEKMLAPLEEEQEAAPAVEKQQEKF